MARFELHNDAEKELVMTALDNVYMEHPEEEMGLVKKRGEALRGLEERGLISIDFDAPVWVAGDHIVYYKSKIYELLCHTALEASRTVEGCLFNLPVLRPSRDATLVGPPPYGAARLKKNVARWRRPPYARLDCLDAGGGKGGFGNLSVFSTGIKKTQKRRSTFCGTAFKRLFAF